MTRQFGLIGYGKKLGAILLAILLIITLLPALPAQNAQAEESLLAQSAASKISLQEGQDYAPGEAIVVMDESAAYDSLNTLSSDLLAQAEPLMTVSEGAFRETKQMSRSERATATASQKELKIKHITSTSLSTEQLLETLAADARVLSVEPNYLFERDPDQALSLAPASQYRTAALLPASATSDATDYQWANDNTNKTAVAAGKLLGFDLNPPKWATDRTTPATQNASGTVAIVDSGIDYDHPDLKNVMRSDMKNYVSYGGDHGFCSVPGMDPTDPADSDGHGTHCAGIVASEWNSFGTSGIASGANVKVVAVRVQNDQGGMQSSWALKGFAYLAEAMQNGLNLKAINNSWGAPAFSRAYLAAVNTLGDLGALSFFASGNDALNVDYNPDTSVGVHQSPYSVVVNSSNAKAARSDFSSYGRYMTDVFAPGSEILSTYPRSFAEYLPEVVASGAPQNLVYESFVDDGTQPLVQFADTTDVPATLGQYDSAAYFDQVADASNTKYSWRLEAKNMHDGQITTPVSQRKTKYTNARIYLTGIDTTKVSQVAFHFNTEGWEGSSAARMTIACESISSPGKIVEAPASSAPADSNMWGTVSLDLEGFCAAFDAKPKFETDGVDTWLNARIDFVIVGGEASSSTTYHVDAFGVGTTDSAVAYKYLSGTSMATPAAVGAAAVIAAADDASKPASEQAKLRAARVKGSTIPVAAFADLCTSGGELDLSSHAAGEYTPVLDSAQAVLNSQGEYELTVEGYFFGSTPGTITLSGVDMPVKNWTDSAITVVCPVSTQSGLHEILVTSAAQGKTGRGGFTIDLPEYPNESKTPLFEIEYPLPTEEQGFEVSTNAVKLAAVAGELYLMPISDTHVDSRALFRLDRGAKTWDLIKGFPTILLRASMTEYDGKLILTGLDDNTNEQRIWTYDPSTDAWDEFDAKAIPFCATIVNCNGALYLAGGQVQDDQAKPPVDNSLLLAYDLKRGTVQKVADLQMSGTSLFAQAYGDSIVVGDGHYTNTPGALVLVSTATGAVTDLAPALPLFDKMRTNSYGIATVAKGIVVSGATGSSDGTSLDDEDTYLLDLRSSSEKTSASTLAQGMKFEPLGKRASNAPFYYPSSIACDGALYTYGLSPYEPNGYFLRATAMEVQPDPQPTPQPTPTPQEEPNDANLPKAGDSPTGILLAIAAAAAALWIARAARKRASRA